MEHFIDVESDISNDIGDIKEGVKNMESKFDFVDSNVGDFIQDEVDYIKDMSNVSSDKFDQAKDIAKNMLDKIGKNNTNLMVNSPKRELFNFSWKLYRTFSLFIIFISFFVLKFVADILKEKSSSEYIINLFKVVSVLIILNLCAYLFYKTYNRYLTTIKGVKGPSGKRGVKGIPGKNDSCNIYNKKIAPFNRDLSKDKKPPKEKVVLNTEELEELKELKKQQNRGVYDPTKLAPTEQWKTIDSIQPSNNNIGFGCDTATTDTTCEPKQNISDTENKPIIGAAVNYNKLTNNIEAIQYYYDKNKKHNKNKYKIGVFGRDKSDPAKTRPVDPNSGTIGKTNVTKHSEKYHFNCEPNSAIYKVEGIYDSVGIKGLKFYCQDIKSGKSSKAFNKDNEKVYGVNFGIDVVPDNDSYLYSKVECPYEKVKGVKEIHNKDDKYSPTFISNIGGIVMFSSDEDFSSIKNLNFNNCSFFSNN